MGRIAKLETELEQSRAQVAWFHRNLFGQKAEKVEPARIEREWGRFLAEQERRARHLPFDLPERAPSVQLLLMLGQDAKSEPTTPESALALAGLSDEGTPPAPPAPVARARRGRKPIPSTLERVTVRLEPDLGGHEQDARLVDTEVSYRIGIRPAEIIAIEVERPRYAVDLTNGRTRFECAETPSEMIERGLFAPSALAHVLAMKWERHVPYSRLASFFSNHGYEIPVSTLSGVSIRAEPLARALVEAMTTHAKKVAPYLAIDATGARLQARSACVNGHTWMRYVENVCVLVSFTEKHDSDAANEQLDGWSCPYLADGAAVFNDFERRGKNDRGGCFSHARRKFFYAMTSDPRALVGLKMINDIFALERGIIGKTAEQRLEIRRERAGPIFDQLVEWARGIAASPSVGPRSLLAKAARYLLNQQERLHRFLENGRIPIHNNLTELQVRHFAVGRKNWLFYGSERAAAAGSTWMSLVLTARMHDLHVETYFRELFRVLPVWPKSRLVELAPHAWRETRQRLSSSELEKEFGPVTIPPVLLVKR